MEELRKLSPSDIKPVDTSVNMCKLTNYVEKNNIDFTNKV